MSVYCTVYSVQGKILIVVSKKKNWDREEKKMGLETLAGKK